MVQCCMDTTVKGWETCPKGAASERQFDEDSLALGGTTSCQPICDPGYHLSASHHTTRCEDGTLTVAVCEPNHCSAEAVETDPANGNHGNCIGILASGASCQNSCNSGFRRSGDSRCHAGEFLSAACKLNSCPLQGALQSLNGTAGNCEPYLGPGQRCQPRCYEGTKLVPTQGFVCEILGQGSGVHLVDAHCVPNALEEVYSKERLHDAL